MLIEPLLVAPAGGCADPGPGTVRAAPSGPPVPFGGTCETKQEEPDNGEAGAGQADGEHALF
jgi:hypothetical protein